MENKYKMVLLRFRISSHDLNIETGSYENDPRNQRLCKSCNINMIEDEFHFFTCLSKLSGKTASDTEAEEESGWSTMASN